MRRKVSLDVCRDSDRRRAPIPRLRVAALPAAGGLVAIAVLLSGAARAQDATWLASPSDGNFNNSANWNPAAVPIGGTAFFDTSATTALSFSAITTIDGWTFNAGASAYIFSNSQTLVFNGDGIVINGGSAAISNSGFMIFNNTSTAGSASITDNGGSGFLQFNDASTAGSASIIINNSGSGVNFYNTSTAGSAAISNSASGVTYFSNSSGPNGDHKLSAGSLAGGGWFFLGANELTVGNNNLSTTVTGRIADGGFGGGTGGSLVKIGTGTLALFGTNTYIGATMVNGGLLEVDGSIAASSGVTVNSGGTLGGTGTVSGTIVAAGGKLAPGPSIGTLNVTGNLAFNSGATYAVDVSPTAADRTRVTGTAALAGTVAAALQPGSYVAKKDTILSADFARWHFRRPHHQQSAEWFHRQPALQRQRRAARSRPHEHHGRRPDTQSAGGGERDQHGLHSWECAVARLRRAGRVERPATRQRAQSGVR
jgi:autotransporter-associated beta strand protein